jgi:hypothetical protein
MLRLFPETDNHFPYLTRRDFDPQKAICALMIREWTDRSLVIHLPCYMSRVRLKLLVYETLNRILRRAPGFLKSMSSRRMIPHISSAARGDANISGPNVG